MLNGGSDKDPVCLPICVAAGVVVLPFVMRFDLGRFGVERQVQEALLAIALGSRSLEGEVCRMGWISVVVDGLRYAGPSVAARGFRTLRQRGGEAYSSREGQSRRAAAYCFHFRPPFG